MAKVCVIGLWHLGCVVASSLAQLGHDVTGVDFDVAAVDKLVIGQAPVFEPGLEEQMAAGIAAGRLRFTTDFSRALEAVEAALITFDTPVDDDDRADLGPIDRAFSELALHLPDTAVVVVSSQIPAGSCRRYAEGLGRARPEWCGDIAYSPENLRLGEALSTFTTVERLVIGAASSRAAGRTEALFDGVSGERLVMSLESAEMAKHALNSFLALSVSYANEVAALAETAGADMRDVVRALKTDRRIGAGAFLSPGMGFAGGTLARDVQALRAMGGVAPGSTPMLDATLDVNRRRKQVIVDKLKRLVGPLEGTQIAILGLTYKPGTNTLRRSISLELALMLLAVGAVVTAHDPMISELPPGSPSVKLFPTPEQAASGAAVVVLATAWPEYARVDPERLGASMARRLIVDTSNSLDSVAYERAGFAYEGIGVRGRGGGE